MHISAHPSINSIGIARSIQTLYVSTMKDVLIRSDCKDLSKGSEKFPLPFLPATTNQSERATIVVTCSCSVKIFKTTSWPFVIHWQDMSWGEVSKMTTRGHLGSVIKRPDLLWNTKANKEHKPVWIAEYLQTETTFSSCCPGKKGKEGRKEGSDRVGQLNRVFLALSTVCV